MPKAKGPKRPPGNPNWKPGCPPPNPKGRPKRDESFVALAKSFKEDCIRELQKMAIGTALPWKVKYDSNIAVLALGGHPLPRPPQALPHSGPDGQPLKTGGGQVFIYNSRREAEQAAAAHLAGSPEEPVLFLPSNGYEVKFKPDGTPDIPDGGLDDDPLDEPLPLAPRPSKDRAGKIRCLRSLRKSRRPKTTRFG